MKKFYFLKGCNTMLKGKINLSLLIGPAVPIPVPKPIIDALTTVRVTSAAGEASGFQLTFSFSNKSPLNMLLLFLLALCCISLILI